MSSAKNDKTSISGEIRNTHEKAPLRLVTLLQQACQFQIMLAHNQLISAQSSSLQDFHERQRAIIEVCVRDGQDKIETKSSFEAGSPRLPLPPPPTPHVVPSLLEGSPKQAIFKDNHIEHVSFLVSVHITVVFPTS